MIMMITNSWLFERVYPWQVHPRTSDVQTEDLRGLVAEVRYKLTFQLIIDLVLPMFTF